jgi:hypothetical protein
MTWLVVSTKVIKETQKKITSGGCTSTVFGETKLMWTKEKRQKK